MHHGLSERRPSQSRPHCSHLRQLQTPLQPFTAAVHPCFYKYAAINRSNAAINRSNAAINRSNADKNGGAWQAGGEITPANDPRHGPGQVGSGERRNQIERACFPVQFVPGMRRIGLDSAAVRIGKAKVVGKRAHGAIADCCRPYRCEYGRVA
eukprot:2010424-Rhodomonas_salina.1